MPLDVFETDWQRQWLVERGVEIISEASRHLTDELKARHPEIPWQKVAGIGKVLRHNYESIVAPWLEGTRSRAPASPLQGCKFGRYKVANCYRRNEIFSNFFVAFRNVRDEFSTHYAKQAFVLGIENTGA
jgi:hypothetical protein